MNMNVKKQKILIGVLENELKYEDYKFVLFSATFISHKMNRIHSKHDNIGAYKISTSFSLLQWQKYILEVGYHKLSYFHKFNC